MNSLYTESQSDVGNPYCSLPNQGSTQNSSIFLLEFIISTAKKLALLPFHEPTSTNLPLSNLFEINL